MLNLLGKNKNKFKTFTSHKSVSLLAKMVLNSFFTSRYAVRNFHDMKRKFGLKFAKAAVCIEVF